jgi:hypothetical protein
MYTVLPAIGGTCSGGNCLNGLTSRGVIYIKNAYSFIMTDVVISDTIPIEYLGYDTNKA